MAETILTVRQIMDLGLWDKVREYKGWDSWILNEGRIDDDTLVTFDSKFKKELINSDAYHLAEYLHEKLCTWNHTDGCAWYYHTDNWDELTHKRYLNKAIELSEMELDIEDIKKVIEIVKSY